MDPLIRRSRDASRDASVEWSGEWRSVKWGGQESGAACMWPRMTARVAPSSAFQTRSVWRHGEARREQLAVSKLRWVGVAS